VTGKPPANNSTGTGGPTPSGHIETPSASHSSVLPGWAGKLWRYRAWLVVGLVLFFSLAIRVRLRDLPLERDEGEYAYAGQLILGGVPPYRLAYNMKFPGTYVAYAMIMAVFGQTPSGIHIGLALVSAASILLMFLLSRKWLDEVGAVTATGVFALMTLNYTFLGLAAHATHFVVLAALGGLLLSLREVNRGKLSLIFAAGFLFGLGILMKQHGVLFGVFAGLYLGWTRLAWDGAPKAPATKSRWNPSRRDQRRLDWKSCSREVALFAAGMALPYLLTCLWLWKAGVFGDFVFWTVSYASKYVSSVPMSEAPANLRIGVGGVFGGNPFLWILAGVGALIMWWDSRLSTARILITGLALFSIGAISAGFYFRHHYFILLLPALGMLSGAAVSRGVYLLRKDRSIELLLSVPILLLLAVGTGAAFVLCSPVWFAPTPAGASQRIYGTTLFSEAVSAAKYIAANSTPAATIGVLGSEPEIYFLARRRSATGYIYMYPLMESHGYALNMQEQLIHDLESKQPEYIVFVSDNLSWLTRPNSRRKVLDWWENYWTAHYEMVRSQNVVTEIPDELQNLSDTPRDEQPAPTRSTLLIFKRKSGA